MELICKESTECKSIKSMLGDDDFVSYNIFAFNRMIHRILTKIFWIPTASAEKILIISTWTIKF